MTDATSQHLRLHPAQGGTALRLDELWSYRELLYFFTWRDLKVRYKQTLLGASWAILQPLLTMLAFSLFFGRLAGMPSDGLPYPVFTFVALVPWTFFANALVQSSNSVVGAANLIRKVYFPRPLLPVSCVAGGLVDFVLAFLVLVAVAAHYRIAPTANILALPILVLLLVINALGLGLWVAAVNVQFRDVRYVVPFLTQLWLYSTPVAYPLSLVPERWRMLYSLNPMVGVVEGFRWALLGGRAELAWPLTLSALVGLALLAGGLYYFRRVERRFADLV